MNALRLTTLLLGFLALLSSGGCGPSTDYRRLTVREGYTTPPVIQAFEARYALAESRTKPGQVRIEGDERVFATISQAVAEAPDEAVVHVGAGLYRDAVVVSGKRIQLRGEGPERSVVLATETALYVSRAEAAVTGIGFASLTVGGDVSVVAVSEGTARLTDCHIFGGTGPGLLIAGREANVSLTGNIITGNMAGGVRVQGGQVRMQRNAVVRNAVGGIVLAPALPGAIQQLSLWHDTVLDNWSGHRCVSFARVGVVPVEPLENYRIEASIINSGGMAEVLSEAYLGQVRQQGRNFVSAANLPAPDFFVAPDRTDYRPRAGIVKDSLGIELGAFPSESGLAEVKKLLNNALVSEKLQLAYLTSLFLPTAEREQAHERIHQIVSNWVGDFLKYKRLGTRLFAVLGLARVAPEHWRMEVILARFLEGFIERYTFVLKPLNFFPEDPTFGARIESYLKGRTSFIPRFVVTGEERPQAYVLSGRVKKPLTTQQSDRYFEIPRTVENPYHAKVANAMGMLESRLAEQQRKIDDIDFTLNNPHFTYAQKDTRHKASLEKKRVRLMEGKVRLESQLQELRRQMEESTDTFSLILKGRVSETEVRGEIFATLVVAPAGDIMLDTTESLSFLHNRVHVEPLPEYGYEGAVLSPEAEVPEDQAARYVAEQMLRSVIRVETIELRRLLERFRSGTIDSTEEDRLVELLLLNADLYRKALEHQAEYDKLKAKAEKAPTDPLRLTVGYDEKRGSGKQGVTVSVSYLDARTDRSRLEELEALYKPYWELQLLVDNFLKTRFGINDKLFFETREVFERMVGK